MIKLDSGPAGPQTDFGAVVFFIISIVMVVWVAMA